MQLQYLRSGLAQEFACSEPEAIDHEIDESEFVYGRFATGSIVLAKMTGKDSIFIKFD